MDITKKQSETYRVNANALQRSLEAERGNFRAANALNATLRADLNTIKERRLPTQETLSIKELEARLNTALQLKDDAEAKAEEVLRQSATLSASATKKDQQLKQFGLKETASNKEIAELKGRSSLLSGTIDEANTANGKIYAMLKDSVGLNERHKASIGKCKAEHSDIETLRENLGKAQDEIRELKRSLNSGSREARRDREAAQKDLRTVQAQRDEFKAWLEARNLELDQQDVNLHRLEEGCEQLSAKLDESRTQLTLSRTQQATSHPSGPPRKCTRIDEMLSSGEGESSGAPRMSGKQ